MDEAATTRIQQFNQLVRSLITCALAAGLIYGFIWSRAVSAEVFVPIVLLCIQWWFQRDERQSLMKQSAELLRATPEADRQAAPSAGRDPEKP